MQKVFSWVLVVFLLGGMEQVSASEKQRIVGAEPETPARVLTLPDEAQKTALGIPGANLKVRDEISWTVVSKDGQSLGVLLSSEFVGAHVEGYMGPTPVFILVGPDNKIKKLVAGMNDESPEYFEMAAEGILPAWQEIDVRKASEVKVDAVSGATYSSLSLIRTVKKVLAAYHAGK